MCTVDTHTREFQPAHSCTITHLLTRTPIRARGPQHTQTRSKTSELTRAPPTGPRKHFVHHTRRTRTPESHLRTCAITHQLPPSQHRSARTQHTRTALEHTRAPPTGTRKHFVHHARCTRTPSHLRTCTITHQLSPSQHRSAHDTLMRTQHHSTTTLVHPHTPRAPCTLHDCFVRRHRHLQLTLACWSGVCTVKFWCTCRVRCAWCAKDTYPQTHAHMIIRESHSEHLYSRACNINPRAPQPANADCIDTVLSPCQQSISVCC